MGPPQLPGQIASSRPAPSDVPIEGYPAAPELSFTALASAGIDALNATAKQKSAGRAMQHIAFSIAFSSSASMIRIKSEQLMIRHDVGLCVALFDRNCSSIGKLNALLN
jgi:hypothetical protein